MHRGTSRAAPPLFDIMQLEHATSVNQLRTVNGSQGPQRANFKMINRNLSSHVERRQSPGCNRKFKKKRKEKKKKMRQKIDIYGGENREARSLRLNIRAIAYSCSMDSFPSHLHRLAHSVFELGTCKSCCIPQD